MTGGSTVINTISVCFPYITLMIPILFYSVNSCGNKDSKTQRNQKKCIVVYPYFVLPVLISICSFK